MGNLAIVASFKKFLNDHAQYQKLNYPNVASFNSLRVLHKRWICSYIFFPWRIANSRMYHLSGNIILSWLTWPRCCLAMAASHWCFLVKPSITVRDDGSWYCGPHTEGVLLAHTWQSRVHPCSRRPRSRSAISWRKPTIIHHASLAAHTRPNLWGLLKWWTDRPHSRDL